MCDLRYDVIVNNDFFYEIKFFIAIKKSCYSERIMCVKKYFYLDEC